MGQNRGTDWVYGALKPLLVRMDLAARRDALTEIVRAGTLTHSQMSDLLARAAADAPEAVMGPLYPVLKMLLNRIEDRQVAFEALGDCVRAGYIVPLQVKQLMEDWAGNHTEWRRNSSPRRKDAEDGKAV